MSSDLALPTQLSWCIPLYGFAGMLLSLPWATGWPSRNASRPPAYGNVLLSLLGVLHGAIVLRDVASNGARHLQWSWLQVGDLDLVISFDLSTASLGALELITVLSLLSQVYALGYLDKEWALARFFALAGFFEGAMVGVVLSDSLFQCYFLLEMLTLSTYLLVGFWYAQPLVVTAARDAFLTKRVGDIALLMGVVALSASSGVMSFEELYSWAAGSPLPPLAMTLISLALIAGPTGKCAQFPMHLWLDEAMEGPNPASILRNSVVVTCGALVLLRLMPILQQAPVSLVVLELIGTVSALGGSLVALAQVDIKRTLSYSTTAYLGLVFLCIAQRLPAVALLLLLSHALAKALLSMSTGAVIAVSNAQDITELGGLAPRMPATTTAFLVGSAGLTALLPLGGFWSSGLALDLLTPAGLSLALVLLLTNLLSVWNLTRVYRQVFLGPARPKTRRTPEVNWQMALPMVTLTVIVLLTPPLMARLDPVPGIASFSPTTALLLIGSGLAGLLAGALQPLRSSQQPWPQPALRSLRDLLAFDFHTERFYRLTIVNLVAFLSRSVSWFDRTVVDGAAHQLARISLGSAEALRLSISGQSQAYVLTAVAAIVMLLAGLAWVLPATTSF
ncbi:NAD(P)H-quinone oxidoreductase subunit F [Synechococcus sp. RSCCF101]|uniref:NAD(P)H-quinone oxidoreductase subunit F n=1 Tax=Synechococcus sp. RSCCF101 TaxID=2511069 RepID=UPI00124842E8|nr:NAD(P)H-quinone oxidoreductase subunit F [Synechococcus sp. RSCCF101]QEY31332.1 NAD(P)H-quinone oxidoreductase subunit F [Synechococcus sp. RSCCF101]